MMLSYQSIDTFLPNYLPILPLGYTNEFKKIMDKALEQFKKENYISPITRCIYNHYFCIHDVPNIDFVKSLMKQKRIVYLLDKQDYNHELLKKFLKYNEKFIDFFSEDEHIIFKKYDNVRYHIPSDVIFYKENNTKTSTKAYNILTFDAFKKDVCEYIYKSLDIKQIVNYMSFEKLLYLVIREHYDVFVNNSEMTLETYMNCMKDTQIDFSLLFLLFKCYQQKPKKFPECRWQLDTMGRYNDAKEGTNFQQLLKETVNHLSPRYAKTSILFVNEERLQRLYNILLL